MVSHSIVVNKRKNLFISSDLERRALKAARERKIKLSQFIRTALESYLERLEREKIEHEIAEACRANYNLDKKIASEWQEAEADVK